MNLVDLPASVNACENLIGGRWQRVRGGANRDLISPYTGQPVSRVGLSSPMDVDAAVAAARAAFDDWRATPIKERTRPLYRYRDLLAKHIDQLANTAAVESGKTRAEARAGLLKGIEIVEFALGLPNLEDGGAAEVSRGVTCERRREPLGVVLGITPFNFPAMVPMWMFPIAITMGNTFILKPSERVAMTACRMGDLMMEAGFPAGVFSVVQGDREAALMLVDHADVKAVAFVGSTPAARSVYGRAAMAGKRALCLGSAKNHIIVVPDAEEEMTVRGVVDSFTGCAGQRCMAASVLVAVGGVDRLIEKITAEAARLDVGAAVGAIIDMQARDRIRKVIDRAEQDGAKISLDGRQVRAPAGYEGGNWLGPTIIDNVRADFDCARSEIFGPVLTILRVPTLDEALAIEKQSSYGNATSVFTQSGAVARKVADAASSGMVGVNIGVPVPREPFSFGGTKASRFGHGDITGQGGVDFWTQAKKITTKWTPSPDAGWMS